MRRDYCPSDLTASFMIMVIGVSEASHLLGVFLHRPLSQCATFLLAAFVLGCIALGCTALFLPSVSSRLRKTERVKRVPLTGGELGLAVFLLLLAASQAGYVLLETGRYVQGDMTVETVESFLRTGSIYGENPLTGGPVGEGMPARLKVLCLPTLYASICTLLHVTPQFLVWKAVPVVVLLGSYGAYACLARSLFPDDRRKRLLFLVCTSLLFWVGSHAPGMDGFGLLTAGWRGETLRGAILVPYAVSLCLRRKYLHAVLCCIAETCILWTSVGLGACAVAVAGLFLSAHLRLRKAAGKEGTYHDGTP